MSIVNLADQKAQMNVTFDDDDALIQSKIDAAEAVCQGLVGSTIVWAAPLPADLMEAIKMLAAHLYENREASSIEYLNMNPLGFCQLIAPYREWSF